MDALPELERALEDERTSIRLGAAYALHRVGSVEAAAPLFRALNDTNYLVRSYAYEALDSMGLLDLVVLT